MTYFEFNSRQFLNLEKPRRLDVFKQFLNSRKDDIKNDLEVLSSKFNINIEKLYHIREKIRNVFGKDFNYFSTTVHYNPWEIDFLRLARERIDLSTSNKTFYYPVFYQKFNKEKPHIIDVGEIEINLVEIVFELLKKKKEKKFLISQDFHQSLLQFLSKDNWESEIVNYIQDYFIKNNHNFFAEDLKIIVPIFQDVVVSVLKDYNDFFLKIPLNTEEEVSELNSRLAQIFIENYDSLYPLLEKLNLDKEYLQDLYNKKNIVPTVPFFVLICILGGYVHIGAEYGKFNSLRQALGLNVLEEPPLGSYQERFKFFEPNSKDIQSGTLRFIFGSKLVNSFLQMATYEGMEDVRPYFSPFGFDEKLWRRIRLIDFYMKNKNLNYETFFQGTYLNRKEFISFLEAINYWQRLNDEEQNKVQNIFKNLADKEINILDWVDEYNHYVESNFDKNNSRLMIRKNYLKAFFIFSIFKNYSDNLLQDFKEKLPSKIFKILEDIFLKRIIIEKINLKEEISGSHFYGIQLPLELNYFNKEDIVNFARLFYLETNNWSPSLLVKFLEKI